MFYYYIDNIMEEIKDENQTSRKIGKESLTRKDYNSKYYEKNKAKLQENYKREVCCPLCDSKLKHSTMNKHLNSTICKKKQEIKKRRLEILGTKHE